MKNLWVEQKKTGLENSWFYANLEVLSTLMQQKKLALLEQKIKRKKSLKAK